jgi:hypothetical protein
MCIIEGFHLKLLLALAPSPQGRRAPEIDGYEFNRFLGISLIFTRVPGDGNITSFVHKGLPSKFETLNLNR